MYQWLICYLIEATEQRYKNNNLKLGKDSFTAKNDAQVFYARSLSLAFIEASEKLIQCL
jgi:acyl-CoA oxidase